jgi:His-Xaa-Ser system protein HxsD
VEHKIEVDLNVYSLDALKRSLYRFSDRFSSFIQVDSGVAICTLTFGSTASPEFVSVVLDNFRKELLDQDLRDRVRKETEAVRNLILSHALSKTGLIGDESI